MIVFQVQAQSHPQSSLFLLSSFIFQSKESEAAKSLIQEVFLLCSCIKKVTVAESLIPDEQTTAAYTGFNI